MLRKSLYLIVVVALTLTFDASISGKDKAGDEPGAAQVPNAASATGARAEFLEGLAYYQQRYTRLAEAVPAEKYAWRPGEGVRSIGEVYAHITAANYGVAHAFGMQPPSGLDFKAIQTAAGDKAKITQLLTDSFGHLRQAILAINDGEMDKPQKMFGRQTTVRGAFTMIIGHFGEHLGQSIAYARVNGITPPWTEEAQQQQQKLAEKPKP